MSPAQAGAAELPDGRAYELVTPPDLLGSAALAIVNTVANAPQTWSAVATDGSGVLWFTRTLAPDIDSTGTGDTYLTRRGSTAWTSAFVSPPGSKILAPPVPAWATAKLDRIVWQAYGATIDPADQDPIGSSTNPLAFMDLYRRDPDGAFTRLTKGSLADPVAGEINVFDGASADGSTVVFTDNRQLEPDAAADGGVYQRTGQVTKVVSKDENGIAVPSAAGDGVSDDGEVVAFDRFGAALYLRDMREPHAVHIADFPAGDLDFQSLSADGRKVFFITSAALTSDDLDTSKDLYEYDAPSSTLRRLSASDGVASAGPGNSDACATPVPALNACDIAAVAVSRDGSKAYFVSPEQLDGTRGADGAINMYLAEAGTVRFVATLDGSDPVFGAINGSVSNSPLSRAVRFTPDGSKLLFESRAPLTGYDNAGHIEIYVHASATDSLTCASCRPSGAPPTGDASLREGPGPSSSEQFSQDPMQPANADEHGDHIFFSSSDALVPQDTNGRWDVYEQTVSNGGVALISSGLSPNDSAYLGNSHDGKDVFFFTTETLVPQDRNGNVFKIYDARAGGGFPAPPPAPECVGDGCRGPVEPAPTVAQLGTAQPSPTKRRPADRPAASSRLTVSGSRSVAGTSARLTAKVSGAGQLRTSGSGVVPSSVTTRRATAYRVTVRLSKSAARTFRRRHRLKTTVTVRFTPRTGTVRTVRVPMTFTTKKGR
ncbi:MAG: hypothetical protein ABW167_10950 [Baekduia sp.]